MNKYAVAILPLLIFSAAASAQDPTPADAPQSYRITVNFEENSLELAPLSAAALDSVSAVFARNTRSRYEVHGYSCLAVAGQKTARLSPQRVERMVERLMSLGIPPENIVTVVNAHKAAAGSTPCTDDRRVDIISTGATWRIDEYTARLAELQTALAAATESGLADSLKAEMAALKRRLADASTLRQGSGQAGSAAVVTDAPAPPAPPTAAPPPTPVQPVVAEQGKQAVAVYMNRPPPMASTPSWAANSPAS